MGFALSDIQLKSPAFENFSAIPSKHSNESEDISPALNWENPPEGTKAYAVICHDPDAPLVSPNGTYGFVHWVLYNIPAAVTELDEATDKFTQGTNNYGNTGYNGPLPPEGHGLHHYYFWVLALDNETELNPGLTLWELLESIEPNIIGMNRLIGTYQR